MADNRVTIIARVKAKEGMEESVKQDLLSLVAQTRSEEGCINYDLHQSVEDKSRFLFYENWRSQEDMQKHLAMPYITAILARADQILAEPLDLTVWEMISEKSE